LKLSTGMIGLGVLALASGAAQAQDQGQLAAQAAGPAAYAGTSFGSPIAYGAQWRDVGIGVYGQTLHKDAKQRVDGAAGLGFGLGDADKYVALETDVGVATVAHRNGLNFGDAGSLGFKLHTNLPGNAAFAVGVVGTGRWGPAAFRNNNVASVYAVGTKVFSIGGHALVANLGLGDGQFQRTDGKGNIKSGANVFGGLSYYICRQVSIITDYTGRFFNAGVSIAPIRSIPVTITLGAVNIGNQENLHTQFGGSLGFGFHI
ncbi:MAG: hypothetical protein ACRETM_08290, partial [Stenotrophobium sp.]